MSIKRITKEHIAKAKKPTGEAGKQTLERMNVSHEELTNWALSFLKTPNVTKVLDIGCGGGATVRRLINKYPNSFVSGIDYSNESVKLSKNFNADILNKKCEIQCADVHSLPYSADAFDVITAFETVYFWEDLNKAFAEVKRVLSKNGEFLICCESSNSENEIWQDVLGELRILTENQWKEKLQSSGWQVKQIEKQGEWITLICQKSEKE